MIKEWYYETFINGKKYRVNCVESDGYGGSRVRTNTLTRVEEEDDEEAVKVFKKPNKGEEVEKRSETTTPE